MNNEKIIKSLLKFVRLRINILASILLAVWFAYILSFVYQNLSSIYLYSEEIVAGADQKNHELINQDLKEKVFSALEEKTKPRTVPANLNNPFQ